MSDGFVYPEGVGGAREVERTQESSDIIRNQIQPLELILKLLLSALCEQGLEQLVSLWLPISHHAQESFEDRAGDMDAPKYNA